MQSTPRTGWGGAAALALCLAVLAAAPAAALDYNDVRNLLRNQVPESVIISMAQQNPNLTLSPDQANVLRSLGASESLIAAIRPAAIPEYVVPEAAPPSQSYGYDENGNIVYFDSVTGQVLSTVPQIAPAPVIIEPAPTVIYETPTYIAPPAYFYPRGPSWGFSINIGGRDRWRGRHGYRPHPPGPPRGGRPPRW